MPESWIPVAGVPNPVFTRLPGRVLVILEEDEYETKFGDGKFQYPRAAFWDEARAKERRDQLAAAKGYLYTIQPVDIRRDAADGRFVAEVGKDYSLADVVRLLSEAQ